LVPLSRAVETGRSFGKVEATSVLGAGSFGSFETGLSCGRGSASDLGGVEISIERLLGNGEGV
jgi:hypothetical protein